MYVYLFIQQHVISTLSFKVKYRYIQSSAVVAAAGCVVGPVAVQHQTHNTQLRLIVSIYVCNVVYIGFFPLLGKRLHKVQR